MDRTPDRSPAAPPHDHGEPHLLADHPALDMLNTVAQVDGAPHDFWPDDADVLRWLQRTGWLDAEVAAGFHGRGLARAARGLREAVRELVALRKQGRRGDPEPLNACLRKAPSHVELAWEATGEPRLERCRPAQTAEQLLAPLAEAAAALLAEGDFELVRECEHPECTLWFYDRTKSHRRRWCSMAVCGNRHKVAEFRRRQR